MSFALIFSLFSTSPLNASAEYSRKESTIHELYDQKAAILAQYEREDKSNYNKEDKKIREEKFASQLKKIDIKLMQLGVEFLSNEQLQYFMNKQNQQNYLQPLVAVPTQNNVIWSTYKTTFTRNGKSYEVQRLVAQPKVGYSSNLKDSLIASVKSSYNWKAGAMALLTSVTSSVTGAANPPISFALAVYDAIKSFAVGISKETVIASADIAYHCTAVTTAIFSYVKEEGKSDNTQVMTFISTKVKTDVHWVASSFVRTTQYGQEDVADGKHIYGDLVINSVPSGFDDTGLAVDAFINPLSPRKATVSHVKISAIEDKPAWTYYPVNPQGISHIY